MVQESSEFGSMMSELISASLLMFEQISKQTFSININEHVMSGGNALLDRVTVKSSLRFIINTLFCFVTA